MTHIQKNVEHPVSKKLGKYEIIERLGRGGMAEVYRAYNANLARYEAIKVLHTFLADAPEFKSRFEKEAQNIARLKHPNIIQVYDFDFDAENESYYMVMELIEGGTLKDRLQELAAQNRIMPLEETLRITREAASALSYAHKSGMIHRDVKPANLMLDKDNRLVLTDFGIAKMVTGPQLTITGGMVGTPAYMAPEQGMGEYGDERSDLYSLGVIFYEMLIGHTPYSADTPLALILQHVNQPVPTATSVKTNLPPFVDKLLEKMLAKSPDERYQTADDLIAELDYFTEEYQRQQTGHDDVTDVGTSPKPPEVPTTRLPRSSLPTRIKDTGIRPVPQRSRRGLYLTLFVAFAVVIVIGAIIIAGNNGLFAFGGVTEATATEPAAEVTEAVTQEADATAVLASDATSTATMTATATETIEPSISLSPTQTSTDRPAPTATIDMTVSPSPTVNLTETQSYILTATTSACQFDYAIIEQTPPDGEAGGFLRVNTPYTREITFLNTGTCTWERNTSLTFIEGEDFSAGPRIFIREPVEIGAEVTILFDGVLPPQGSVQPISGRWQLRTPGQLPIGEPFSISVMVFDPGT